MSAYTFELMKNRPIAGAGDKFDLGETFKDFMLTCELTDPSAGVSALSVAFEATQNPNESNPTWFTIVNKAFSAANLTDLKAMWAIVDKPCRTVRANITTLTGGDASTKITVRLEPRR